MSTRSALVAKLSDGSIKAIYVHHDGYGHLPTLQENYNSQEEVNELISLGDLSSLGETLESCHAYHRDGKEDYEEVKPTELDSLCAVEDLDWGQEYIYQWDGSSWTQSKVGYDEEEASSYSEDDIKNVDWSSVLRDYDEGVVDRETFLSLLNARVE